MPVSMSTYRKGVTINRKSVFCYQIMFVSQTVINLSCFTSQNNLLANQYNFLIIQCNFQTSRPVKYNVVSGKICHISVDFSQKNMLSTGRHIFDRGNIFMSNF